MFGRFKMLTIAGAIASVAFLFGQYAQGPASVHAEVRESKPRKTFKSGAARSEPVLREILATLRKIDGRLQRIEGVVLKEAEKDTTPLLPEKVNRR